MNGGQESDEELAQLAAGGDERAFSDLYNRYFPEIFDYAIRISRDRDIAALVLQSSFLRLYQLLQAGTPPPSIKLHLYAGAHHDLAERMRARRSAVVEGEEAFVVGDPSRIARSVSAAEVHEQTRLLWQALRGLKPDDYELLDLNIRRGLSDQEIASFMRTRQQSVQARLESARQMIEESFSSLLLMTYGRRACLDLDFLVAEDKWSTSLRRRILQHMTTCAVCQGTRRAYMSAAEGLAAIALVPGPPGWQAIMLSRLLKARQDGETAPSGPLLPAHVPRPEPLLAPEVAASQAPSASPYSARPMASYSTNPGMFERMPDFAGRGPLIAVFGGALLIVAMIFGALCSAGAFDGGSDNGGAAGTATGTTTSTRTRTPTKTPTVTSTSTLPPEPTETPAPTEEPTEEPLPTATPVPPTDTPVVVPATNTPPPLETPVTTP